ncbi:phage tail sheath subtilisin-like domain-containing protein [Microbulbifer sp. PSTR4-B]|uniref:phage tail sheath subtilisin-like domain-containing protein n=1 Tax=unclassified Microbulbifer TaxID=2619833 RepID=UPI00403AFAB5
MSTNILHGVGVTHSDAGPRDINLVKLGCIGIAGTAPNAAGASKAVLTIGTTEAKTELLCTAVGAGVAGNALSLELLNPNANSAVLSVGVNGSAVTVKLATDATGELVSTADEVRAALAGNASVSALMTVANGDSDGSGKLPPMPKVNLSGGSDEPFPLNTPVLITGSELQASALDIKGTAEGSLPDALDGILDQAGALVVVVRVEKGADEAGTLANVIGGESAGQYTGLHALRGAESVVGERPRIVIAPGFSSNLAVATELNVIAERVKGVAYVDAPDSDDAAAKSYRANFGSKRLQVFDPSVLKFDAASGANKRVPLSAIAAGVRAKRDSQVGFWASISNQEILGIVGSNRPVDFIQGDPNSRANLLNQHEITTVIRQGGFRLWGNRTCSADPKWAFETHVRIADAIEDSIQEGVAWAVDKNINRTFFEDVAESVNNFLRRLTLLGAIHGGTCTPDPDLNNPGELAAGRVYFNVEYTPVGVAESIRFQVSSTNRYLAELVA